MGTLPRVCPAPGTVATPEAFLEESFELMGRRFKHWLEALQSSQGWLKTRYRRLQPDRFTADIYSSAHWFGHCSVKVKLSGADAGIAYSEDPAADSNTFIECLAVENTDIGYYCLRPVGMRLSELRDSLLTADAAAREYWRLLIAEMPQGSVTVGPARSRLR